MSRDITLTHKKYDMKRVWLSWHYWKCEYVLQPRK